MKGRRAVPSSTALALYSYMYKAKGENHIWEWKGGGKFPQVPLLHFIVTCTRLKEKTIFGSGREEGSSLKYRSCNSYFVVLSPLLNDIKR